MNTYIFLSMRTTPITNLTRVKQKTRLVRPKKDYSTTSEARQASAQTNPIDAEMNNTHHMIDAYRLHGRPIVSLHVSEINGLSLI